MSTSKAEKTWKAVSQVLGTSLILGLCSACGKAAFEVKPQTDTVTSPGTYSVAPKVDILLAEDDTGSMSEVYGSISSDIKVFLNSLTQSGWDYHFATIPLTSYRPIKQVVASDFDGNSASWVSPYPGATKNSSEFLDPSFYRSVSSYSDFLTSEDVNSSSSGTEPAFENIKKTLENGLGTSGLFRSDSLAIVLAIATTDDTSRKNICKNSLGISVPCEEVGGVACDVSNYDPVVPNYISGNSNVKCGTQNSSFTYYQDFFKRFGLSFYSAVAFDRSESCMGFGSTRPGTRYQKMAGALGGESYDICNHTIGQVLTNLKNRLQASKVLIRTRYLFMSSEPDPSSIQVFRNVGGDSARAVLIAQDTKNGWSYEGSVKDVYSLETIAPTGKLVLMNKASGFAVRLNGSAMISGSDTAAIQFKPAGAKPSSSK